MIAGQQEQLWEVATWRLFTVDRQEPSYEYSAGEDPPAAVLWYSVASIEA